ncbi:hypothetical protein [Campylobacter sp. MG1]|uniref:hypothetical protein n=1 Tax=Campylobacter sp. MG1 TaxID=2976332 RepID=UPI00226CA45B|nr:hypothetical protein [Campylobacter sp. MG1]
MLKFDNIIWLLRKNFFITIILLILMLFFSFYVNYTAINDKLINNNKLINHSIQNTFKQNQIRLDLYIKALEINSILERLDFDIFSAFYYLDKNGNVLKKHAQKSDDIDKFIEINESSVKNDYISELITNKDFDSSIYFAKKIKHRDYSFLVAKLDLNKFLKNINKFSVDFILVDSFGNVLYSSDENKLRKLENINNFNFYWYLSGIYQTSEQDIGSVISEYKGFNIRSFISSSEFFNYYFVISAFLLLILVIFLWNSYLDSLLVKNGIIKQSNYCYDLLSSADPESNKTFELLAGSDLLELQKQTGISVLEYNEIREEYSELEQRLSSMFSKSTIPMFMIDAFTAKIFKANQSALDFYKQKITSMSKMNLYMLGKRENNDGYDPIGFANNMQNSIKNQGYYIQTEHYVNGDDYKEVKIYPFIMRSERFCYDILMILDTNIVSKSYENIKTQYEALEKSFIITMTFNLQAGQLKIKSCSKNVDKILGHSNIVYMHLKDLLHEQSIPAYTELLLKLRNLKNNQVINYSRIVEQKLYFKQSNGRYAEFKVSFSVKRDYNYENKPDKHLNIIGHFALLRQDILDDEIKDTIVYEDIYKQVNINLAIFDKDFSLINASFGLKRLLKFKEYSNIKLNTILSDGANEIKHYILNNQNTNYRKIVFLKDVNDILIPCKMQYLTSINYLGDKNYYLIFKQESFLASIDDFIYFCKNKGIYDEYLLNLYFEYYYELIGIKIDNKETFDGFMLDKFFNFLSNLDFNDEETMRKCDYLRMLINAIIENNRIKIIQIYDEGKLIFRRSI